MTSVAPVIIGMDPHKRSATIEIINEREKILAQGRFGTDRDGYQTQAPGSAEDVADVSRQTCAMTEPRQIPAVVVRTGDGELVSAAGVEHLFELTGEHTNGRFG